MSDSKKNTPPVLDLGLSAILSGDPRADLSAPSALKSETVLTSVLTLDDDEFDFNRELFSLAQSKQWGVLVSRAESSIKSDEDLEARLWWIRGHLGAFSLPVSLLAAPFESVCRQLHGDARLEVYSDLVLEIGELVLGRLKDVGDRRQEYIVRLGLQRLGLCKSEHAAYESCRKTPPKVPHFELGVKNESAGSVGRGHVSDGNQFGMRIGSKDHYRAMAIGFSILGIFLLGLFIWRGKVNSVPQVLIASESLLEPDQISALQIPSVSYRPVAGNLGALFYSLSDLNRVDKSNLKSPASQSTGAGGQSTDPGGGVVRRETSPASVLNARGTSPESFSKGVASGPGNVLKEDIAKGEMAKRTTVRTDGPLEGTEFKKGINQNPQLPRLPDSQGTIEGSETTASSYPDGSLVLPGEVRSVMVRTDVYDSADFRGRVIAHLSPGDKVSVESRFGRWARIRSRRGRAGFVFAQDIGDIDDFSAAN